MEDLVCTEWKAAARGTRREEEGKNANGGLALYIWAEERRGAEGGGSALVDARRTRQHLEPTPLAASSRPWCTSRIF